MQLIAEIPHAFSTHNEITDVLQVALVASFKPAAIMNNETIVIRRNMFLINGCFAAYDVGSALTEA